MARHTATAMPDLELTRSADDRKVYVLEGVGTLRMEGLLSRRAVAEADGRTLRIERSALWRPLQATDETGGVVGRFDRRMRGGGTVCWDDRELPLRRASVWRERFALVDGDREIALIDGKGWGRRPVRVTLEDPAAIDPALLLFAVFVVNTLAADDSAAASSGSVAATGA